MSGQTGGFGKPVGTRLLCTGFWGYGRDNQCLFGRHRFGAEAPPTNLRLRWDAAFPVGACLGRDNHRLFGIHRFGAEAPPTNLRLRWDAPPVGACLGRDNHRLFGTHRFGAEAPPTNLRLRWDASTPWERALAATTTASSAHTASGLRLLLKICGCAGMPPSP